MKNVPDVPTDHLDFVERTSGMKMYPPALPATDAETSCEIHERSRRMPERVTQLDDALIPNGRWARFKRRRALKRAATARRRARQRTGGQW